MDAELLRRRVEEISWYHSIPLGDGIVTPGVYDASSTVERLHLPDDLSGKSVLDIGAWDGFFSFEAERRGADRVLAVDSFSWSGPGWGTKEGFELAREALGSQVEDREMEVLDVSPEAIGEFDIVLFLGVLYHMRHPLLALERVASVTRELLVLETAIDMSSTKRPAAAFYPGRELDLDQSNWWGPNPAAVEGMVGAAGFREIRVINDHRSRAPRLASRARKIAAVLRSRLAPGREALPLWRSPAGRLVVHASK
jgi:tRNA (mo5U34)-methyltransferase